MPRLTSASVLRAPRLAIALGFALLRPAAASAQTVRLHDTGSEQLSREALATFGKIRTPSTSVFTDMLRNLNAGHDRNLTVLWEQGQANLSTRVNRMVEWNWGTFVKEAEQTQREFLRAYQTAAREREEITPGLDQLAAQVKLVEGLIQAAKRELAREGAGPREVSQACESLGSAIGEIQKIAADPVLSKKLTRLRLPWMPGYLQKLAELTKGKETEEGLQPIYVDLAMTLTALELESLKTELAYRQWVARTASERLQRLTKIVGSSSGEGTAGGTAGLAAQPGGPAREDPGEIIAILRDSRTSGSGAESQGRNRFGAGENELILVTLDRLARKAHQAGLAPAAGETSPDFEKQFPDAVALRELLNDLAKYASIVGYQKFLLEADDIDNDFHSRRETIFLTELETKKLNVLMAHSLSGLSAYYGGGIRPADILNMAGLGLLW